MKRIFINSVLATIVLTVVLGIAYPLAVIGIAQLLFRDNANGQLLQANGELIGSRIIGQPFTAPRYFHSRPSAAGTGYDAANSSGSNLGPTNLQLVSRVNAAAHALATSGDVPVDLVTTSASGLDPDITPAAAHFQSERIARERHMNVSDVNRLIDSHITPRQFGVLGEPRVNVLELNLALDRVAR